MLATTTPSHNQKNARRLNGANGEAGTTAGSATVTTRTLGPSPPNAGESSANPSPQSPSTRLLAVAAGQRASLVSRHGAAGASTPDPAVRPGGIPGAGADGAALARDGRV